MSSYISINQDGSVVGWIGKVDMAQGTEIGWIKMIAEELDVAPERVSMVQGNTEETVDQGGASGSTGIWFGGIALRNAAAEARLVLVEMAAAKLGVAVDQLTVNDGVISVNSGAGGKKVTYGELIGGKHFDVQLEWNKHYGNELRVKGRAKPKVARRIQNHRQARHAPPRHRAQGARHCRQHGGRQAAGHAARTHDPAAGGRRGAGGGGRIVGKKHSRRESRLAERISSASSRRKSGTRSAPRAS